MVRILVPLIVGTLIISGGMSCSSDNSGTRKKAVGTSTATKANKKTNQKPDKAATDSDSDPEDTAPETDTCPDGAALQGASLFETANVVISDHCVMCHNSDTSPGGNFSLPATLKFQAAGIKERINLPENDPMLMPKGEKLSAGQIGAIVAWVDAGAPLPADADPNELPTQSQDPCSNSSDSGTGTSTEDSTGTTSPTDPIPEAFKPYIDPEAKKLCHDQGKPFSRETSPENPYGICYEGASYPAPFNCTYDGVLAAFNNNPSVKTELDKIKAKGYTYDDCGVFNDKPIVFFVCFTNGDEMCRDISDIAADRLVVRHSILKQ